MLIGKVCAGEVITINKATTIQEAAKLMKENHVSCLVVVNGSDLARDPIGYVTDNDIVIKAIAGQQTALSSPVSKIMDNRILIMKEDTLIRQVLQLMSSNKTKRGVIVSKEGNITGLTTADDLLVFLAHELYDLAEITQKHLEA